MDATSKQLAEIDQILTDFWTKQKEMYKTQRQQTHIEIAKLHSFAVSIKDKNEILSSVVQLGLAILVQRMLEWDIEARDEVESK